MNPFIINEGIVQNSIILPRRFANLEHGELKTVAGIILHQTNRVTAEETLFLYRNRDIGAHFLISPEGAIYQTARIDRICYHVGYLAPRCKAENRCSPNYLAALDRVKASTLKPEEKLLLGHRLEMAKQLPARYPSNLESIGIEVAGRPRNNIYPRPSAAQDVASTWLVARLLAAFKLQRDDVFKHGNIGANKTQSEANYVKY